MHDEAELQRIKQYYGQSGVGQAINLEDEELTGVFQDLGVTNLDSEVKYD